MWGNKTPQLSRLPDVRKLGSFQLSVTPGYFSVTAFRHPLHAAGMLSHHKGNGHALSLTRRQGIAGIIPAPKVTSGGCEDTRLRGWTPEHLDSNSPAHKVPDQNTLRHLRSALPERILGPRSFIGIA